MTGCFFIPMRTHVKNSLKKIERTKSDGYPLEALIHKYILVVELLTFITQHILPKGTAPDIKPKTNVKLLLAELERSGIKKGPVQKKDLKALKTWLSKMDRFIKSLRYSRPGNITELILEGEKVLALINISAEKLMGNKGTRGN